MQPLKFGNGCVVSYHTLLAMQLFIHAVIKVNSCQQNGPLVTHRARAAAAMVLTKFSRGKSVPRMAKG